MSLLWTICMSLAASAYIPEFSLLTSHAADQHGKGVYQIEQEVIYKQGAEAFTVKETWLVAGENAMRLTLEGRGPLKGLVQGTIVFTSANKTYIDAATSAAHTPHLGEDWLEPMFHFRNSKYIRNRLVTLKVVPAEAEHERPPLPSEGDVKYEPPSFLRLSRVGGAIAWAIGIAPSVGVAPTMWLEQDQFVLRKYRGANQAILHADDYAKYEDGFWYPRQRTYGFGGFTIEVQTLRVKSLGKLQADDKSFKASSLSAKDALKLPDTDALKEFYSRFR